MLDSILDQELNHIPRTLVADSSVVVAVADSSVAVAGTDFAIAVGKRFAVVAAKFARVEKLVAEMVER